MRWPRPSFNATRCLMGLGLWVTLVGCGPSQADLRAVDERATYHYKLAYGHYMEATTVNVDAALQEVLAALRANLRALELEDRSRVMRGEVGAVQRRLGRALERFDLVLLDPPYGGSVAEPALRGVVDAGLLVDRGVVILERSRRHPVAEVPGLVLGDERRYGDSVTCWFRLAEGPALGPVAERTEKDSEAE